MEAVAPHAVEIAPPSLERWAESGIGIPYAHERASGIAGPEVLLTALVHGNEYSGAIALDAFLRSGVMPRRGRITAVFCNVAAFSRFDAGAPDASRFIDEDFNRVWSADVLGGTGRSNELQRAREIRLLVDRATHLLDLHSMHEPCSPLLVTGLLPRNIEFAQALCTPSQVIADAGHADGTRMRDYGAFADADGSRVALLLEAGQHWDSSSVVAARNTLMRFLACAGVIDNGDVPPGWLLPAATPPSPLVVTHRVVAQSMDFRFAQEFHGGELLHEAGTLIGHDKGIAITTPYKDCVVVMPSVRQLRPGVTVARLGRHVS